MKMAENQGIFIFVEVLAAVFGLSGCLLVTVQKKVPLPYMDEIFHVPQARQYCDGNFTTWDPMITTPPGLYITTIAILRPVEFIFAVPLVRTCTVLWLRSINVLLATGSMIVMFYIFKHNTRDDTKVSSLQCVLTALSLCTLPVLYFFSFLYYTDPGSTFFVLLAYYLSIHKMHTCSGMASFCAVLYRQTNIVWVVFIAAGVAIDYVQALVYSKNRKLAPRVQFEWSYIKVVVHTLATKCKLIELVQLVYTVIMDTWCYITVGVLFALFIFWNGSIVVGAKTDHVAGLHFAQLYYFSAFCGVFAFPQLISLNNIKQFLVFLYKKFIICLLFCTVSCYLIWNFTYAHRYLLSDNRHYTFYIWSKILNRHELVKIALIPAYLFAYWCIHNSISHKTVLWRLMFFLCLSVNLVPSMLLELRYFIVPYLIWRLNIHVGCYPRLMVEIVFNFIVNAVTLYLFLEKPFKWPNDSGIQRFMW